MITHDDDEDGEGSSEDDDDQLGPKPHAVRHNEDDDVIQDENYDDMSIIVIMTKSKTKQNTMEVGCLMMTLHSLRGERIDERFTDDNEFWRYTGKIGNPYGDPLYEVQYKYIYRKRQTQRHIQICWKD